MDETYRTPEFFAWEIETQQRDKEVVYAEDLFVEKEECGNKATQAFKTPEAIFKINYDHHQVKKRKQVDIPKQTKRSWFFLDKIKSFLKVKSIFSCIDAAESNNEFAEVDYVEDIYQCYKLTENSTIAKPGYMEETQKEIDAKMRARLVDWLIEVHTEFKYTTETLYLTIQIVDRYLSTNSVSQWLLTLVGISALRIASKYEENQVMIRGISIDDYVCISKYYYSRKEIIAMEKLILQKLEWRLTVPTPYVFLVSYIKAAAAVSDMEKMEDMAFFLAELGLIHYELILRYSPSMLAASSVFAARCTLKIIPFWNKTLEQHTGFSVSQILDCAKLLVHFHSMAVENNLRGVCTKYSCTAHGAVALLPPAETLLASF
ncbi:G2/mitotic-specific cyclin-1 [Thalictrum thalictroides]|uniref:G2/mitotic-specific cyclin-1 n=1 Tax=Thalictrum thalictroides TaxID=46969 RepID=A0A7J6UZV3_THATH|nr:G2/mitotic-specific cyclin-1 [Thalictrum thalictroides]